MIIDDKRKSIVNCNIRTIKLGETQYCIICEAGRGGNAIAYNACYKDNQGGEHNVIIKELFPYSDKNYFIRNEDGDITIDKNISEAGTEDAKQIFEKQQTSFEKGNKIQVKLLNKYPNSIMGNRDIYSANGTKYIVLDAANGTTLKNILESRKRYNKLTSLHSIAILIDDLLTSLEAFHNEGILHLDIAPDNIFVFENETNLGREKDFEKVAIIDYNSVWDIEAGNRNELYYSIKVGYTAPEVINKAIENISYKTDLFSVVSVMFTLLKDRVQIYTDRINPKNWELSSESDYCKDVQYSAIKLCNNIISKGLKAYTKERYQNIEELRKDINKLIKMTEPKKIQLINKCGEAIPFFKERPEELSKIDELFDSGSRVVRLCGIGGYGKSELAVKYANIKRDEYNRVYIASYHNNLIQTISDFEFINYISEEKETVEDRYTRKMMLLSNEEEYDGKTLIVIDNFNVNIEQEQPQYNDFTTRGKFRIMFTTRNYSSNDIVVKRLSKELILELFYEYYKTKNICAEDIKAIEEILEIVDYHTLTVELIAKSLNCSDMKPADFLRKFKEKGLNVGISEQVDAYNNVASKTMTDWINSVFDIADLDEEHKYILMNMTLVPAGGIERALFKELLGLKDNKVINDLNKRGWLKINEDTKILSLHPVICDVVYRKTKPNMENCKVYVNSVKKQTEKTEEQLDMQLCDLAFEAIKRIDNNTIKYAKFCNSVAVFLEKNYLFNNAIFCYEKELDIRKIIIGEERPIVANIYNRIGLVYGKQSEYEKALVWLNKALEISERVFGQKHSNTALIYYNIGQIYLFIADYSNALHWTEKASFIFRGKFGASKIRLISCYNNMGMCYLIMRNYFVALEIYNKALEISKKIFSDQHPNIAVIYNALAKVYCEDVEDLKTCELLRDNVECYEEHGYHHHNYSNNYNNCIKIYYEDDRYKKALELSNKAIIICERAYGYEHTQTANTYEKIADVYNSQGNHESSLEWYNKALVIYEKTLGKEHPSTVITYIKIAEVYNNICNYEKALEWYSKAFLIREKMFSLDSYNRNSKNTYYYKKQSRYEYDLRLYKELLIMRKNITNENTIAIMKKIFETSEALTEKYKYPICSTE